MNNTLAAFQRLLTIMDELREQCPWDREQTFASLRTLSIEEIYELSEAIVEGNSTEIKKELGDLFLHLVFYARMGRENGWFTLDEVLNGICDKLIERHPHIYGEVKVKDADEVRQNWEAIKLKKGSKGVLSGVPSALPALVKAYRISEKAAGIGFDWPTAAGAREKVEEELKEMDAEWNTADASKLEEEAGDLLFSVVNLCRKLGVNPEDALEKTNRKFIRRFNAMEEEIRRQDKDISQMNLDEMEEVYQQVKSREQS